jgi:hypothetical protein
MIIRVNLPSASSIREVYFKKIFPFGASIFSMWMAQARKDKQINHVYKIFILSFLHILFFPLFIVLYIFFLGRLMPTSITVLWFRFQFPHGFVFGSVLTISLLVLFVTLQRLALREKNANAAQVDKALSCGDFTLYLRPFISDTMYTKKNSSTYQDMTPTVGMGRSVIAIGSPHQKLPPEYYINVTELNIANDKWQSIVQGMMLKSQKIFILCGTEEWVRWEIDKIFELDCISKTVFLIPYQQKQQVWVALINKIADKRPPVRLDSADWQRAVALFFTSQDDAVLVESDAHTNAELLHATYLARFVIG